MCKRICDKCGSKDHIEIYGICGTKIICGNDSCNRVFEFIYDVEAAPLFDTWEEAEQYAKDHSYVNVPEIIE